MLDGGMRRQTYEKRSKKINNIASSKNISESIGVSKLVSLKTIRRESKC